MEAQYLWFKQIKLEISKIIKIDDLKILHNQKICSQNKAQKKLNL